MPVPDLITTIGDSTSNSYITLAEASDYFDARLDGESWADETDDRHKQALLKAAKRLNGLNWLGSRVTTTQALAWPRIDVPKRDSAGVCTYGWGGYLYSGYGDYYRSDEIPDVIKEAQAEFAFALLEGFDDDDDDQVDSFGADGMNVHLRLSGPAGSLPSEVSRLIGGLIRGTRLMRA